jgi:site-specific DNA-adenine methylase
MKISPLFKYTGGKRRLIPHYSSLNLLPKNKLISYSESFFGAGAVFCYLVNNKVINQSTKVYLNDLNFDIINLLVYIQSTSWETIKSDASQFEVIKDKNQFKNIFSQYKSNPNPLTWLFLMRNSFAGSISKNGYLRPGTFVKKPFCLQNLEAWSVVLKSNKVVLSQGDYLLTPTCDFNFVDPPYPDSSKTLYDGADQNLMPEILKKYKNSNSLICNKKTPQLLLLDTGGWNIDEINFVYNIGGTKTFVTELTFSNY